MALNKNKVIAAAQRYTQRGQYDRAIKEYKSLVELEPDDVRIWLKIGDLYTKKGAVSHAVQTYTRVAEHYRGKGFFLKAVAVYKSILKIDRGYIDAHLALAEMYVKLGLVPDAIGQYQIVVGAYERTGRRSEGLELLKRIVDIAPDDVGNRIRLAEGLVEQGKQDDAIEQFKAVLDNLEGRQRWEEFVQVAERLLYVATDQLDIVRRLANVYVTKGEPKRALARLQLLFRADPRDADTLDLLAQTFAALGQISKAVSVYRELGRIHAEAGHRSASRAAYRKLLDLEPDDFEALEATGHGPTVGGSISGSMAASPGASMEGLTEAERIQRYLEDVDLLLKYELNDHAIERLRLVFEIDPHQRGGLIKQAEIFQHLNRATDAIDALMHLARIDETLDLEGAKKHLKAVISIDPGHDEARAHLARLERMSAAPPAPPPPLGADAPQTGGFELNLDGMEFDDGLDEAGVDPDAFSDLHSEPGVPDDDPFGDLLDDQGSSTGAGFGDLLGEPPPDDDAFGDLLSEPPATDDAFGDLLSEPEAADDAFGDLLADEAPAEADDAFGDLLAGEAPAEDDAFGDLLAAESPAEADDAFGDLLADAPVEDDAFGDLLASDAPETADHAFGDLLASDAPEAADDAFGDLLGANEVSTRDDAFGDLLASPAPAADLDEVAEAADAFGDLLAGDGGDDGFDDLLVGSDAPTSEAPVEHLDEGLDDEIDFAAAFADAGGLDVDAPAEAEVDAADFVETFDVAEPDFVDEVEATGDAVDEPIVFDEGFVYDDGAYAFGGDDEPLASVDEGLDDDFGAEFEAPEAAPVLMPPPPEALDEPLLDDDLAEYDDVDFAALPPPPALEPELADPAAGLSDGHGHIDLSGFDLGDFDDQGSVELLPHEVDTGDDALRAALDEAAGDDALAEAFDAPEDALEAALAEAAGHDTAALPSAPPASDAFDLSDFDEADFGSVRPVAEVVDGPVLTDVGDLPPPMVPEPSQPPVSAAPLPPESLGDWDESGAPPIELEPSDDISGAFESIGALDLSDDTDGLGFPELPPVALDEAPSDDAFEVGEIALDDDDEIELLDDDEIELLDDDEIEFIDEGDDAPVAELIDHIAAEHSVPPPQLDAVDDGVEAVLASVEPAEVEAFDLDASALIVDAMDADDAQDLVDAEGLVLEADDLVQDALDDELAVFDADALGAEVLSTPPPVVAPPIEPEVFDADLLGAEVISDAEAFGQAADENLGLAFDEPADLGEPAMTFAEAPGLVADDFGGGDEGPEPTTEALPSPTGFAEAVMAAEAEAEVGEVDTFVFPQPIDEAPEAPVESMEAEPAEVDLDAELDLDEASEPEVSAPEAGEAEASAPEPRRPVPAGRKSNPLAGLVEKLAKGPKPPAPPSGFGFFDIAPVSDAFTPPPEPVAPVTAEPTPAPVAGPDVSELDFMLDSGLLSDARELLEELATEFPGHAELESRRGRIDWMEQSDAQEADDLLGGLIDDAFDGIDAVQGAQLSELSEDDANTHFDLGVAFKEMGQYRKAIEQLEKAARSVDKRAEALRLLALCHLEQGAAGQAVELLEDALRTPGLTGSARVSVEFDLATAYEGLGRVDAAIEHLESIAKQGAPAFLDVEGRLARLRG